VLWVQAAGLGAVGGLVVEAISMLGHLTAWQQDRRLARVKKRRVLPGLSRYVDLPAHALVALTRLMLGALAGGLMHEQIDGAMAAVAVGASAPALLTTMLRQFNGGQSDNDALPREGGSPSPGSRRSSRNVEDSSPKEASSAVPSNRQAEKVVE